MRVHHARFAVVLLLVGFVPAAAEPAAQHKRPLPDPIAWLFRVTLHLVDEDALPARVLHVAAQPASAPATPQPWTFDADRDRGARDQPQPQPLAAFRFGRGWTLASASLRDRPRPR